MRPGGDTAVRTLCQTHALPATPSPLPGVLTGPPRHSRDLCLTPPLLTVTPTRPRVRAPVLPRAVGFLPTAARCTRKQTHKQQVRLLRGPGLSPQMDPDIHHTWGATLSPKNDHGAVADECDGGPPTVTYGHGRQ